MTTVRIQQDDYRRIRNLIFDTTGNYDPAVVAVNTRWNGPFDITFREDAAANAFVQLCTSEGIAADLI